MSSANYIMKILTLGESDVGKTSIVLRYSDNKFHEKKLSTIGIDYKTKYVKLANGKKAKLLIWETAGQEKFINIIY